MLIFLASATISLILTLLVRRLAIKNKILDIPDSDRKRHNGPVPLWGGLGIFLAFWIMVFFLIFVAQINHKHLPNASLIGVFIGSLILIITGLFDDKLKLKPVTRLLATAMAALAVIIGGTQLTAITNPFGGVIPLDAIVIGNFLVLANVFVFFWIFGMTYTVKILDGLDGLATGIVLIGALMIYFLTFKGLYFQADVSQISLVLAGVCAGFLILNFYPAKIYLGESGGLFIGFILGVLAVVAGGKIATALLVLAVPILDLARVIYLRVRTGQPVFSGDRRHLHYRLLDLGLSHRQAVILLYLIAFLFGISTLFLKSNGKLIALLFLTVAMVVFGVWLGRSQENK